MILSWKMSSNLFKISRLSIAPTSDRFWTRYFMLSFIFIFFTFFRK
eukprot:UN03206